MIVDDKTAIAIKSELGAPMEQSRYELAMEAAQVKEVIGHIRAAELNEQFNLVARLVWFKKIKDEKSYKKMGITWDEFCEHLGVKRRTIDDQILNLAALGERFMQLSVSMGLGYRDLRKLRYLSEQGNDAIQFSGETVSISGEVIPLTPDRREDLQVALEHVVEGKLKLKDELEKERKSRERIIHEETKALATERDALVRQVQALESKMPQGDSLEWSAAALREIFDHVAAFANMCSGVIVDDRLRDDPHTQGVLYGMLDSASSMFDDLRQRFDAACERTEI